MNRLFLSAVALAAVATAAFAADPAGSVPPHQAFSRSVPANVALASPIPTLDIDDVPVEKVINYLRETSGANIVVNWKVLEAAGVTRDTPISLQVKNLRLRKALQLVLDQASPTTPLVFDVDQNVIGITTQDQADSVMVTKVYIVDDLVMPDQTNIQPPQFDLQSQTQGNSGGGGSGALFSSSNNTNTTTNQQTSDQKGQDLANLIREIVRPTIWKENGGPASMRYFNGKLIVTAPRSVHEAIGGSVDSTTGAIRVGM